MAAYRLEPQDGRLVIAEVRVIPYRSDQWPGEPQAGPTPAGGLPATVLRTVQTEAVLKAVTDKWQKLLESDPRAEEFFTRLFREFALDKRTLNQRARPHQVTDSELAFLAADYVELCSREERAPRKKLADSHALSDGQIRKLLQKARERGLLNSVGPGRPGGTLTTYARQLLA